MDFSINKYNRWRIWELLILFFWYISLFPGRVGYDYKLLSNVIRSGESTDWWTALYFWLFKILTLNANTIAIISLLQIFILYSCVSFFLESFNFRNRIYNIARLSLFVNPIFGAFAMNVSHDVTFSSGLILLSGLLLRNISSVAIPLPILYPSASALLLTSHSGIPIVIFSLLYLLFRKKFKLFVGYLISVVLLIQIASISVKNDIKDEPKYFTLVADLKCIYQHPESKFTSKQTEVLEKIAPASEWRQIGDCRKTIPASTDFSMLQDQRNLGVAVSILFRYPILTLSAHIQRTAGALPPPFPGPENQINYDAAEPLGLGTNLALQSGPQVLHISVDDAKYQTHEVKFLKALEYIVQLPIYFINQSSWFWGWGGAWLLLFTLFFFIATTISTLNRFIVLAPYLINHLVVFSLTAEALPRYMMSSIIIGVFTFTYSILIVIKVSRAKLHQGG